jgi:PDZ domain-containing protein
LKFYKADGHIYLLSILITNPDAYVTSAELIYSWGRSDFSVMPRSLFYRDGVSAKTEKAAAKTQMVDSQLSAKVAALDYLEKNYPDLNAGAIKPSDISISLARGECGWDWWSCRKDPGRGKGRCDFDSGPDK